MTGTLPPPMMHQACAGTRQYAPKPTPSAGAPDPSSGKDTEEALASQYLTEKACGLLTTPFSRSVTA